MCVVNFVALCSDVRCVVILVANCIRERRGRPEWLEVSVGHPECDECPPDAPHHRACHDRAHWKELLRCSALSDHLTPLEGRIRSEFLDAFDLSNRWAS